jgi:hypothetical protein
MPTATKNIVLPDRVRMALKALLYGPQQGARTYRQSGVGGLILFKKDWTKPEICGAIVGPVLRYAIIKRNGFDNTSEVRVKRMNEFLKNLPEPTPELTAWARGYHEATGYNPSAAL